jgi:hypothetical protein
VKMGPIRCPETSVNNYHTTPRNIPEERNLLSANVSTLEGDIPSFKAQFITVIRASSSS